MYVLLVLAAGYMCLADVKPGAAACFGAWLTFVWYYCMSKKQFGGISGDLAGAFLQICELVMAAAVYLAGKF